MRQLAQGAFALLTLGGGSPAPTVAEHILLFVSLLLLSGAVALQWPAQSVWMHVETSNYRALGTGQQGRDDVIRALLSVARASGQLEEPSIRPLLGPCRNNEQN